jgi:fructan beta-fructosidase
MSNWDYAISTPTEKWRSAMTLPRSLSLSKIKDQYILKNTIIEGFNTLLSDLEIEESDKYPSEFESANLQRSVIRFDAVIKDKLEIELSNSLGDTYLIAYDAAEGLFYTDRTNSGLVDFNEKFLMTPKQKMNIGTREKLTFELVLDASSIEIFINDGQYVMTNQIFPKADYDHFKIKSSDTGIKNFKTQSVKSTL